MSKPLEKDHTAYDFLATGGEMSRLIRQKDWSDSLLGPVSQWPQSLRTALSICLNATMPLSILWSKDLVQFYNDAYITIAYDRHPDILGNTVPNNWPDTWDGIKGFFAKALQGEAVYMEDSLLVTTRQGKPLESYYTMSFSPIRDESGDVGGVFHAILPTTAEVINERRLSTNRTLASRLGEAKTVKDIYEKAAEVLAKNLNDIPFCLFYELSSDQQHLQLQASAGIPDEVLSGLERVNLAQKTHVLPFNTLLAEGKAQHVKKLDRKISSITAEPWQQPVEEVLMLPITLPGKHKAKAVFVAGLSPLLLLSNSYRDFFDQICRQIDTALANTLAYEEERKRAEALAQIDKAKTTFFSNVSHELRTPLTLMLGPIEQLIAEPNLTDGQQESIELLQRNSLRLLKLVNNLLDFTRIEAGRLQATFRPTDLSLLTRQLAGVFEAAARQAGLAFKLRLEPLQDVAYVDHNLWERIVFNLLSNAIKYTFKGSITVSLQQQENAALLAVQDSGQGIPESELPRLFSRFHRIEGIKGRSHEGTGIGLAMVKELVALHGGEISVESSPGKGSTFFVRIPLGRDHLPEERVQEKPLANAEHDLQPGAFHELDLLLTEEDQQEESRPDDAQAGARLLIVDDNADMRHYLKRLLKEHYQLRFASDGQEALEMISEDMPDLVISDIMMPRLDGLGLLRAVRDKETTKTLSVILLSARAGEEAKVSGLQAGADDYLVKPFSTNELLARVSTQLKMKKLRQEIQQQQLWHYQEIERQKTELTRLFQQAPTPIAMLKGQDFRLEFANPMFCELTQCSLDTIMGKTVTEVFPDDHESKVMQLLKQVYDQQTTYTANEQPIEVEQQGKTVTKYMNLIFHPMHNAAGEMSGIILMMVEVDEQVKERKKLETLNRELTAVNTDLDNFVYTASHDLRAPIVNIEGLMQLLLPILQQDCALPPAAEKMIEMIYSSIGRFKRTIADLAEIAKTQKESKENVRPISLKNTIEEVLLDLDLMIREHDAIIEKELEGCPLISFSPKNLRSVVYNLISNAIKYRKPERKPHVRISCRQEKEFLVFRVEDNGLGMDVQDKKALFAMFKRLHTHVEGSGVGLYIVKRIVDNAGGHIEVESEPNKGTTFSIYLPVNQLQSAAVQ